MPDVLPDTRARVSRDVVIDARGVKWVNVHCGNCGALEGMVPLENCTFAFFLCGPEKNDCQSKWGDLAHHHVEPDVLFYERVVGEQLDKHGRLLGPLELLKELDSTSPLSKLVKDRMAKGPL